MVKMPYKTKACKANERKWGTPCTYCGLMPGGTLDHPTNRGTLTVVSCRPCNVRLGSVMVEDIRGRANYLLQHHYKKYNEIQIQQLKRTAL